MAWRRNPIGKRRSAKRSLQSFSLTHEPLERRNLLAAAPVLGNSPPMLAAIADQTVDQGAPVVIQASATDSDLPSGAQLTYQLDPDETPAGATINRQTGVFNWTAPTGATGTFRFVILVSDRPPTGVAGARSTSDAEEFTITVVDANQPPVNTVPGNQTTNEDTSLVFSAGNSNLISVADSDAGAGPVRVTLSVTPNSGTLTLSGVAGLDFSGAGQGDGVADQSMSFTGTLASVNAAIAGMQFTPAADFVGDTTLTIVTNDQGNTGSDGPKSDTDTVLIAVAPVNDAPVVTLPPGPGAFTEDEHLAIGGISIADVDAGAANVQVTFSVANGRILISDALPGGISPGQIVGNGTSNVVVTASLAAINSTLSSASGLDYQGNSNFAGNDTLTVTANDQGNTGSGGAKSDTKQLALSVASVNDAPTASVPATAASAEEDVQTFITGLDVNDVDSAAGNVTVTLAVNNGVLTVSNAVAGGVTAGQITGQSSGSVTLNAPVAAIRATLANASGVAYQGNLDFVGADTLALGINDNGNSGIGPPGSDSETLTINVGAVNDAPVNTLPAAQTTNEETPLVLSSGNGTAISIADMDAAGGTMQVTLAAANGLITLSGTAGLAFTTGDGLGDSTMTFTGTIANINAALNGLTFAPEQNFTGAASLSLTTNDQGNTGSGGAKSDADTLTINVTGVNDAPVNTVPGAQTTTEDTPRVFSAANGNAISIADVDAGGSPVQVTLTGTNGTISLNGTAGLVFTAGDGTGDGVMTFTGTVTAINTALNGMSFTPSADFVGDASLTIATNDQGNTGTGGALSDSDGVTISVAALNDAPVNALPAGAQTTPEDTAKVFSAANNNAISISDTDAGTNTVQVTLTGTNGTISLGGIAGMTFITGDGTGDATMTFTGTIADINTALNGLSFTPALNFTGDATLGIVTNDLGNSGPGGAQTDSDSLTISVTPANDAPVVTAPATFSVQSNQQFTFNAANNATVSVADAEGGTGGVIGVLIMVDHGAVTLNGVAGLAFTQGDGNSDTTVQFTGTPANVNTALNGMVYQTESGYTGPVAIQVIASDLATPPLTDTKEIMGTVTGAPNQPPVNTVPAGAIAAVEETNVNVGGIAVSDPDALAGDNVEVTLAVGNGTLTVLSDVVGGVTSGQMTTNGTASVKLTAPIAAINATLAAAGGVVYRGNLNFTGADTLTVTTNDLGNRGTGGPQSDTDTVPINVSGVNDAPVNTVPAAQTTAEDIAIVFSTANGNAISIADVDAGSSAVQVTLTGTNGVISLNGVSGLAFTVGDGTSDATMTFTGALADINAALDGLSFTPTLNFSGDAALSVTSNDQGNTGTGGALSDSDSVAITVTPVNDPPDLVLTPSSATVDQNQPATTTASATDVEGHTITFQIDPLGSTGPAGSNIDTATIDPNTGVFSFTPNRAGNYSFRILATDNGGPPATSDAEFFALTVNPVNLPPELSPQTRDTELGGGPVVINPTVTNPEGNTGLTYQIIEVLSAPAGSNADTATMDPDTGVFSFEPNVEGQYQFLVSVTDNDPPVSNGDTEVYTINVTNPNLAPVVTVPSAGPAILEDGSAFITGLNMTDADAGTAVVRLTLSAANGLLSVNTTVTDGVTAGQITGNGTGTVVINAPLAAIQNTLASATGVQYAPVANFFGPDTLTVTGNDLGNTGGAAKIDVELLALNVTAVNDAPAFTPGADVMVNEDAGLQSLPWATALSKGPDNESTQTLAFELTNDNPALFDGPVTIAPDGTLAFTPVANANGVANLTVVLRDNGGTANGGVDATTAVPLQITLTAVNDTPVIGATTASFSLAEDTTTAITGLSFTDVDAGVDDVQLDLSVGNGALTVRTDVVSGLTAGQITGNGTGVVRFTAPQSAINATLSAVDGVVYGPTANFNGADGLSFSASDLGHNPAPPRLVPPAVLPITVTPVNDPPTAVNDAADIVTNSSGTTISALTNDNANPDSGETVTIIDKTDGTHGSVTIAANGLSVTYTPDADFSGADSFTYTINDGTPGSNATATVNVTVGTLNQSPVVAGPASQTTNEDVAIVFQASNGNAITVSDPDAAALEMRMAVLAANGTLTLNGTTGLTFDMGDGTADAQMDARGSLAALQTALSGAIFTPNPDFHGLASMGIVLSDLGHSGLGGEQSDLLEMMITVNPINDPPTAGADSFTVAQDASETSFNVLVNDSASPDTGETLTITGVSAGDNGGTISIGGDATIRYTPATGFSGTEKFTYTINDGTLGGDATAMVTVTVQAPNQAPSITVPGNQTGLEDTPLVFNAANGNTITIADPDAGAAPIEVTLEITGGALSLGTTAGLQLDGFVGADSDGSDGTFTFRGSLASVNAALLGLTYSPTANFNGATALSVAVSDLGNTGSGGVLSDADTVLVSITAVNDPPTFEFAQSTLTVNEDAGPQTFSGVIAPDSVSTGPANEAGQGLDPLPLLVDHPELFSSQPIIDDVGVLRFTPAANAHGTAMVTFRLQDTGGTANGGLDTATKVMTIVINPVNDQPSLDAKSVTDAPVNSAINIPVTASDLDGDTLTFSMILESAPAGSNANTATIDAGSGAFSFTPDRDGIYVFRVRATDNGVPQLFREALYTLSVGDVTPPSITAGLANDTGSSSTDRITNDPSISGTATDDVSLTLFEAAVDSSPFADRTSDVGVGGAFAFNKTQLDAILGVALGQGAHTVHLRATDAAGNVRDVTVQFTFDSVVPALAFGLADESKVSPSQPTTTILEFVTLQGLASQGSTITLVGSALSTQANAVTGQFTLPNVPVVLGANPFTLRATDLAGNFSEFPNTITRIVPPPAAAAASDAALNSLLNDNPFDFPG